MNTKMKTGLRYPAINDMIAKAENKYELVLATASRARRIIDGEAHLVEIHNNNPVSIATAEIYEDEVQIVDPEVYAAKQAEKEAAIAIDDLIAEYEPTAEEGEAAEMMIADLPLEADDTEEQDMILE